MDGFRFLCLLCHVDVPRGRAGTTRFDVLGDDSSGKVRLDIAIHALIEMVKSE